ncbi:hypothetical protein [Helicobacter ailurogastricus]|uniref:Lipoprotein n=1 Tax=Helicobacter ailurogastricus TaxID=1578720 RepID=A0A0K2Y922_9HELI|nr:hypothetical protein [Helicobacter ailurogastricus]CRI32360.1 hypothetical protein HAL07_08350 [Helicobacter ailurogastricus]
MRIFHSCILACLISGCGYKAPPFYKTDKIPATKAQSPTTQHTIQEE